MGNISKRIELIKIGRRERKIQRELADYEVVYRIRPMDPKIRQDVIRLAEELYGLSIRQANLHLQLGQMSLYKILIENLDGIGTTIVQLKMGM